MFFCLPFQCKWKKTCTFLTYLIIVLLFTAVGAAIFMALEERESYRTYQNFHERCQKEKIDAIKEIEKAFDNFSTSHDVSMAIKQAVDGFDACHRRRSNDSVPEVFHYFDAVIYAISVHSTVGYGKLVPRTALGRLVTVLYGILGIPLYMAMSIEIGEWLDESFVLLAHYLHSFTQRSPFKRHKLRAELPNDKELRDKEERKLKFYQIFVIVSAFTVYLSAMPVFILIAESANGWDYITSVHFVFSSITLIGFGDLMVSRTYYLTIMFPSLFLGQLILAVLNTRMVLCLRLYLSTKDKEHQHPANEANAKEKMVDNHPAKDKDPIEIARKSVKDFV